jgi:N6-L-threonylcarbamoyladenine synthase
MLACEFEDAVVETLISKLKKALKQTGARSLVIGGGVIANKSLRKEAEKLAKENNVELFTPEIQHSTDNSLMIAIAGAVRSILSKNYLANQNNPSDIEAYGNWQISDQ